MDSVELFEDVYLRYLAQFDDSTSPTDEFINMLKNASVEDLIGPLNETHMGNNSSFDQLYNTFSDSFNGSDSIYSPIKLPSLTGRKETTTFEFAVVGVLLTGISIFGLVGNIVAIIVLSNRVMKGSFSSLLIGKF